jgi:hypothetical protein
MASKFFAGGAAAVAGLGTYQLYRLHKEYPLSEPKAYLLTPTVQAAQPANRGRSDYVYAKVRLPATHAGLGNPAALQKHIDIFFSNPMLRAETWLFGKMGYRSPRPLPGEMKNAVQAGEQPAAAYMGGFFPVVHREPTAVVVWWTAPGPPGAKHETLPGGTQLIGAFADDRDNEFEVAYGCTARGLPAPQEGAAMSFIHQMYMRYLIDSAKREFEKQARTGKV